jgi:hypothetical protein
LRRTLALIVAAALAAWAFVVWPVAAGRAPWGKLQQDASMFDLPYHLGGLRGGKTRVAVEHCRLTTKDMVTRKADIGAAGASEQPLSVSQRLKQAAAVPVLLVGALLSLPLLLLVCAGQARGDEELEDRGFL